MRHPSSQGPGIHGVETELVEQFRHDGFRGRIVAGDDERTAVLRSRRLPVRGQLRSVDMVERLDHLRGREVGLQELGGRR